MRRWTAASLGLVLAGCATSAPVTKQVGSPEAQQQQAAPVYPPAVLQGEAKLLCNISAKENGVQKLELTEGGGIEFDAVVSPLVDGTVHLEGQDKGGVYRFTSHLAKPVAGKLSGVGDVTIEEMDTKVTVTIERYKQPGGPGTTISFSSLDMSRRGIYVEFAGVASNDKGERHAFKVTLGPSKAGSGSVTPRDANDNSHIVAKSVMIHAPTVTTVASSTEVRRIK